MVTQESKKSRYSCQTCHFPTQKELKIAPKTSSVLTSDPETAPIPRAAYRKDSAAMSIWDSAA